MGVAAGSVIGALVEQRFGIRAASPASALPIGRLLMNSASRCFWMSVKPSACTCIDPVVNAA
jgi:hypothetical protein